MEKQLGWACKLGGVESLGISKASTSTSHLRLLYDSGRVPPGKTQVGADLGLTHPGNPRGKYTKETATDHVGASPLCSCAADPPRRLEVGGQWSQPVLTPDWPG